MDPLDELERRYETWLDAEEFLDHFRDEIPRLIAEIRRLRAALPPGLEDWCKELRMRPTTSAR